MRVELVLFNGEGLTLRRLFGGLFFDAEDD